MICTMWIGSVIPIQSRIVVQLLAFYFPFIFAIDDELFIMALWLVEARAVDYGVLEYPSFQILMLVDYVLGLDFSDWF